MGLPPETCPVCGKEVRAGIRYEGRLYHIECWKKMPKPKIPVPLTKIFGPPAAPAVPPETCPICGKEVRAGIRYEGKLYHRECWKPPPKPPAPPVAKIIPPPKSPETPMPA
jgi:hypothetical protein